MERLQYISPHALKRLAGVRDGLGPPGRAVGVDKAHKTGSPESQAILSIHGTLHQQVWIRSMDQKYGSEVWISDTTV